jgi:hypothetical protein
LRTRRWGVHSSLEKAIFARRAWTCKPSQTKPTSYYINLPIHNTHPSWCITSLAHIALSPTLHVHIVAGPLPRPLNHHTRRAHGSVSLPHVPSQHPSLPLSRACRVRQHSRASTVVLSSSFVHAFHARRCSRVVSLRSLHARGSRFRPNFADSIKQCIKTRHSTRFRHTTRTSGYLSSLDQHTYYCLQCLQPYVLPSHPAAASSALTTPWASSIPIASFNASL